MAAIGAAWAVGRSRVGITVVGSDSSIATGASRSTVAGAGPGTAWKWLTNVGSKAWLLTGGIRKVSREAQRRR
jgi:hypothetical protein